MSNEVISLSAGEFLMREGEESTTMYLLKKGSMEVLKLHGQAEKKIGNILAGELVGEMSFLDKQPRCASVRALTECELVKIPSEKFEETVNNLPGWYKALMNTLLDRLRRANARIKV